MEVNVFSRVELPVSLIVSGPQWRFLSGVELFNSPTGELIACSGASCLGGATCLTISAVS